MWKSRARLPLWVPGALTGGTSAGPRERRSEEAVLVTYHLPDGVDPRQFADVPVLDEALDRAVRAQHTGELEGLQPGPGTLTVLAYGDDADRLWSSMEPVARTFPCRPASVTLRYGLVGAPDRTVAL